MDAKGELQNLARAELEKAEKADRQSEEYARKAATHRARHEAFLEALRALGHEPDASESQPAALPRRRVRRAMRATPKGSEGWARRRAAVERALAESQPNGPNELARLASDDLGEEVTPAQVTDILRRETSRFRRVGYGKWTLLIEDEDEEEIPDKDTTGDDGGDMG
ncbi:MAG: hypothetical protein H6825_14070 [Planctomycetes bacterium]|nr:hypothetical protein [Planctomycetota bacterium]